MQYDVIEDVFGTNRDNPDEVVRILVHTCTCSNTSDHPPRTTRAEMTGSSVRKKRLSKLREVKGVVGAVYLRDSFIVVIEGSTMTWAELKADVVAAVTYSVVDERWGKREA